MDVDNAVGEGAEEFAFENAHEASESDVIDTGFAEGGNVALFGFFVEFGAEFSRRDEFRGQPPFARVLKNARALDVADHQRDFRRHLAARDGLGNGGKVRSFAGTEHAETECVRHAAVKSQRRARGKLGE